MNAPFHHILVATDFSAGAEHAMHTACELSRVYSAPLTVLHVDDPVPYPLPDGYMMYTAVQLSAAPEELERRLESAKVDAQAAGAVHVETRLLQGAPATQIVRFAKDEDYDLIVMGTHGRRGVARLLLGSVAACVVQTSECPVLTVRRPAQPTDAPLDERTAASPA